MGNDEDWNVVYSYSRAQAIADGVLVDITDAARVVGFKVPTVLTAMSRDGSFYEVRGHEFLRVPLGLIHLPA